MTHRQQWTTEDKSDWPRGPWDDEPDKVQWIDPATDLDCLIVRNRAGALCGYVGVPPEHPWHGVQYGYHDGDPGSQVEVHGGLTYSDACMDTSDKSTGICHVPAPGRPHDVWWFGFDCNHAWDRAPAMEMRDRLRGWTSLNADQVYRDLTYVTSEVQKLAAQVAEVSA